MIVFISELDACNDISEHRTAKHQVSRHDDLFDQERIFRTENHASSEKEKPYDYGQEKENSLDDLK
jgi:hypothetical protein